MKKKVIFIGSPAFSGSTMLDMMLANDPRGMSMGEIVRLMHPHREHYLEEKVQLAKASKTWQKILKDGAAQLYKNLFETHPEISFFVDSSKDAFWIQQQAAAVESLGYETSHVLIYKEPADIAQSFTKRNRGDDWERNWKNYYRLYFSLIKDPVVISYKNLTSRPQESLRMVCEKINLPFFEGKHEFWNKEHYTFFGNDRTRFHLQNVHLSGKSQVEVAQENKFQTIYYLPCQDESIVKKVDALVSREPVLQSIWNVLTSTEVFSDTAPGKAATDKIKMNAWEITVRKAKRFYDRLSFKISTFYKAK